MARRVANFTPPRTANYVIAGSNASAVVKAQADKVCDGTDDSAEFNTAITAMGAYGRIVALGTFHLGATGITFTNHGQSIDFTAALVYYSGTGRAVDSTGLSGTVIIDLKLLAEGDALTSDTAIGLYLDELHVCPHISVTISDFYAGTGIVFNAASGDWIEEVVMPHVSLRSVRKGIEFTGAGAIHGIKIGYLFWGPYDNAGANYGIKDSKPSQPANNVYIDYFWCIPDTVSNTTGMLILGAGFKVGNFVWDDNVVAAGNVSISSVYDIEIGRASMEHGGLHFFRDVAIPWSSLERILKSTFGGSEQQVQYGAGFTESNAGSGEVRGGATYCTLATGATVNSGSLIYSILAGLGRAGYWNTVHWDKRMFAAFTLGRYISDTEAVGRFQVGKEVVTEGDLVGKGIGIKIANLAMYGESYGAARGEVDLGVTMSSVGQYDVIIFHDPNVPMVMFFVNNAKKGTQSTAANIPTGASATAAYLVASIINGATGGVSAQLGVMNTRFWQEA